MDRCEHSNSAAARSPSPSRANAGTTQIAAWVYWPPFSRIPGEVAFDVTGVDAACVEGRREQTDDPRITQDEMLLTRGHRRAARPVGATCDSTAQACASASIRHSSLAAEPRGVPSS